MVFHATVKNRKGEGIPGAKANVVRMLPAIHSAFFIDTAQWQADGDGLYDVQYPNRNNPDDRACIVAEPNGEFCYRGILPVAYPIVSLLHVFKFEAFEANACLGAE